MNEVMVDIETLGLIPGSAIISIGAVSLFRGQHRGYFVDEYYTTISIESNVKARMIVDANTVQWWINGGQPAGAKSALTFMEPLPTALTQFGMWYEKQESGAIWGNRASFDLVLLEAAYYATELACPWKFHQHRCFRTMKSEFSQVPKVEPGVAHDALSDAKAQATQLQDIWALIDGRKEPA